MQLEAGKKYTDRRGRVYGPLVKTGSFFGECPGNSAWYVHGNVAIGESRPMDLVAEYVEPAPVESPDDWVTLPPEHVLRHTDEVMDIYGWWVNAPAGMHANECRAARCRRKDLPEVKPALSVVDPGEGYRLLEPHEVTLPDDERAYMWALGDICSWETLTQCNPREFVGVTWASLLSSRPDIVIRRKLPPKTRTITLKEYACWDDDSPEAVVISWQTEGMVRHIDYTYFDNEHFTGNERTIEIPL